MARTYDLVIVGTGTAAMGVAMRVRAAGWRSSHRLPAIWRYLRATRLRPEESAGLRC